MSGRDNVVLQRPEDLQFLVPVFHTHLACAGAATAYLLRRIAYRAGAYAPGIQEHVFHELNTRKDGANLESVQRWFNGRVTTLHELGYRLQCRRVANPTDGILEWVKGGRGYRGAMLPTSFARLHPGVHGGDDISADHVHHAIGVTVDRVATGTDEELMMIDPWPGTQGAGPDKSAIPTTIEPAHRDRNYHALVYYWVGWS